MNYTKNYQLNQWEPADRVLRTDFNEDNRKIEEALNTATNANLYVKLIDLTTEAAQPQIDVDVSTINISLYRQLDIYFTPGCRDTGYANTVYVRLNNITSGYHYKSSNTSDHIAATMLGRSNNTCAQSCVHLYLGEVICGNNENAYISTESTQADGGIHTSVNGSTLSPSSLSILNFVGYRNGFDFYGFRPLAAGTQIQIYGLKK